MKSKILVIAGPTAVGKTALGIELANFFNGEIISGDSQQVYRKLDIGTAKVSLEEQKQVKHHLIDVREVTEGYSVYDFVAEAKVAISETLALGKLPIIVGGTGLYLQSLLEGYHLGGELNQEEVLAYRKELDTLSDTDLFEKVLNQGISLPEKNRRRAIRLLELNRFGQNLLNQEPPYDALVIGLTMPRNHLYDRINQRVDMMMSSGLLEEAMWLYTNYPNVQAVRGIGYKEFFPFFKGDVPLEAAVDKLKQNTRRFAKRQLTWFRNRMSVTFYDVETPNATKTILSDVRQFLDQ